MKQPTGERGRGSSGDKTREIPLSQIDDPVGSANWLGWWVRRGCGDQPFTVARARARRRQVRSARSARKRTAHTARRRSRRGHRGRPRSIATSVRCRQQGARSRSGGQNAGDRRSQIADPVGSSIWLGMRGKKRMLGGGGVTRAGAAARRRTERRYRRPSRREHRARPRSSATSARVYQLEVGKRSGGRNAVG